MEKKLLIVVNQTGRKFEFVNKECDQDKMEIEPYASSNLPSINLTSGQHGAGCDIPDCSDKEYFLKHHMEFNENVGAVDKCVYSFWYNDSKDQYYYYKYPSNPPDPINPPDPFEDANVIPGNVSAAATKKAIYIRDDDTLFITDIYEKE
ncbi:hypothetical protein [Paenibacillus sp. PL91]|uniref:hypothetical protein n=1 Tax=Paenibacillus sp. PL91 TaxID=2729538 RepID=UPI00145D9FF2|nr:hypothetical protein [Paenibacillus sp. PL91]MBC9199920.1 hypothetical protein [Paenibacillus sp. PL91]